MQFGLILGNLFNYFQDKTLSSETDCRSVNISPVEVKHVFHSLSSEKQFKGDFESKASGLQNKSRQIIIRIIIQ